ncbi:MarR family transcriptional regulator [Aureibaculum marinum]|uniref:MarR family transcriptional regulator n=1 Tax=Aureibaculum marinum TaxID=2487930 RepID=A0A3N4P099_9FLAO|nr:helix-turn-helix domain-containing protein [Aureibaculum marinum]RPD97970.1 MarR family transcriptional regulator [Aureibaculum marinum]
MTDFLNQIKYEGITSRLKRLSDVLLYSTKDLYRAEGLIIEPNWNLIFRLLQEKGEMTITEMSETLQFSHPAVVKIVNKMKAEGYITAAIDSKDKRKQVLSLTQKALQDIPKYEVYWNAGIRVIEEIFEDSPNILEELSKIELKVKELDYKQRVLLKIK